MSRRLELLAAHKQALMAKASIERLSVALQVESLRARSRVPPSVKSILGDQKLRPILVAVLLFALRRTRFRRFAAIAGIVAAVVKVFRRT